MKRFVYLLLCLALILSLSASVLASSEPESAVQAAMRYVYLSEDLMTATYCDQTYVRFDDDQLVGYYDTLDDGQLVLTDQQKSTIKRFEVKTYEGHQALQVSLEYYDGVSMEISFIRQNLYEQYQQLLQTDTVTVEFAYPKGNSVELKLDYETMEDEIFFEDDRIGSTYFDVKAYGGEIRVMKGVLLHKNNKFYYCDFGENNITTIYGLKHVKVWKITDTASCAKLEAAAQEYYGSGLGIFEDRDFSNVVASVFLIIMFVALPLIVLVLFVILAIKAKTPVYKRMFWNLCAWSGALLIFVGIIIAAVELA